MAPIPRVPRLAGRLDDSVVGGDGDDRLSGFRGDDVIRAGRGDDTLRGGRGDDFLDGGLGGDTFIFAGAFGDDVIAEAPTINGLPPLSGGPDYLVFSGFRLEDATFSFVGVGADGTVLRHGADASTFPSIAPIPLTFGLLIEIGENSVLLPTQFGYAFDPLVVLPDGTVTHADVRETIEFAVFDDGAGGTVTISLTDKGDLLG